MGLFLTQVSLGDLCPHVTLQLVVRAWLRGGPWACRGSGGWEGVGAVAGNFTNWQCIVKLRLTLSRVSSQ